MNYSNQVDFFRIEDQEPVTECKNDFEYVCEEEAPKPLDSYGVPAADPSDNLFNSKKIKF